MRYAINVTKARKLAKAFDRKLPKVGYEVCLISNEKGKVWLSSTGHFQFGWTCEMANARAPFEVKVYASGWGNVELHENEQALAREIAPFVGGK